MVSPEGGETVALLGGRQVAVRSRCCRLSVILVEPVAVLYLLSNGFMVALRTQFLYDNVAKHLGFNTSILNTSTNHCSDDKVRVEHNAREEVQELTAQWMTYLIIAKVVPTVLATLYFGSLSDRLGRKICLILPTVGCMLGVGVDMLIFYFRLPLGFFFFEVVEYFFGGGLVMKLGCSAFVADTVPIERRSMRMTILDALSFSSIAVSALLVGDLKSYAGFFWSFVLVVAGNMVALLYTVIFIPSRPFTSGSPSLRNTPVDGSRDTHSHLVANTETAPSIWRHLVSGILVYTRDDGSGRRWKLNVLLVAFFISALSATGHIITLYELNTPLCWDTKKISLFHFEDFILKAIMMVFTVCLLKRWVKDDWLALCGRVSSVIEHFYLAFCVTTAMMFVAPALGCLNLLTEPMTKTLMTSFVLPEEQGSLLAVFSLAPVLRMASGAFMAPIYAMTLNFMRGGIVFLLSASLHLVSLVMLAIYIWRCRRGNGEVIPSADYSTC